MHYVCMMCGRLLKHTQASRVMEHRGLELKCARCSRHIREAKVLGGGMTNA